MRTITFIAALLVGVAVACHRQAPDIPRAMYQPPATATIRYRIHFENRMSDAFRFHGLVLLLDGGSLLSRDSDHDVRLHVVRREPIHLSVAVTPGPHELKVISTFIGEGSNDKGNIVGYKFELRSSHKFNATPSGELTVFAYEQDVASTLEERPAIQYSEKGGAPAVPPSEGAPP